MELSPWTQKELLTLKKNPSWLLLQYIMAIIHFKKDFRDITFACGGKRNQAHRFIIPFIGLYSNTFKTFSSIQNRWRPFLKYTKSLEAILSNVSTAPMKSSLRIHSICDGVKNVITDSWRHVLSRVM